MVQENIGSGPLEPGESILEAIERANGRQSRVLLRDVADEHSPVVRVTPPGSEDQTEDSRRYLMLGEIARGGVGIVLKGRDKDLGREVAVKVLRKRLVDQPEVIERFIEEAQITGQLHNPGIVPIYDLGLQPDGRPYFVMKLVKGRTLAALLEERADASTERRRFLSVFEQVCRTAGYAHARGVIHRDLKPSNIMLGSFGEVQVVDWGFAKLLERKREDDEDFDQELAVPDMTVISTVRTGEGSSQSIAGSVMGTPAYMPPEQAMGLIDRLDERSDVFSLGAILCEILTGEPPYTGDPHDLLIMAAQAKLDEAHARLDACDAHPDLVALVRRCLQPLRRDRPANGSEVADAVAGHLAAVEERARKAEIDAAAERATQREEQARLEREAAAGQWERSARRKVVAIAAVLLLAVLLGGGGYSLVEGDREQQAQRTLGAVREAEDEARLLEGQERWAEAHAAAERAVSLANQPAIDAETRARTERLRERLASRQEEELVRAARAESDARFVDRLAEIQAQGLRGRTRGMVRSAYGAAFKAHQFDPKNPHVPPNSTTGRAIIHAFEDLDALAGEGVKYGALLLEVDPEPWRVQVRNLEYAGDLAALEKLDASEQPAVSVALLGHALMAHKRWDAAARVLRAGNDRFPSHYRMLALLSDLHETRKEWTMAARHLTAALALRPSSVALRNRLGLALAHAGELDAAVTTLQEGKLQGLDMDGYCQLGSVLARKGDRQGAVDAFREAMKQRPKSARPHYELGQALAGSFGDFEGAIVAYKDALRLKPREAPIHAALGEAYHGNGDSVRALEAIEKALEIDSNLMAARKAKGVVFYSLGRFRDAIVEFTAVRDVRRERADGWYWLARVYLERNRYASGLTALERTHYAGYRGRDYQVLLGMGNAGIGEEDVALLAFLRAVEADKTYAEAKCRAGRTLFRAGEFTKGLAFTRQGHDDAQALGSKWRYPSKQQLDSQQRRIALVQRLEAGKSVPEASVDLAMVHFFGKRYEDAKSVFLSLEQIPLGEARLYAAAAALRTGAWEHARRWMQAELEHWKPRVVAQDETAYRTLMDWREGWLLRPAAARNLAQRTEDEREFWGAFWTSVDEALAEAEK